MNRLLTFNKNWGGLYARKSWGKITHTQTQQAIFNRLRSAEPSTEFDSNSWDPSESQSGRNVGGTPSVSSTWVPRVHVPYLSAFAFPVPSDLKAFSAISSRTRHRGAVRMEQEQEEQRLALCTLPTIQHSTVAPFSSDSRRIDGLPATTSRPAIRRHLYGTPSPLHYLPPSCSGSALLSLRHSRTFTSSAVSAAEADGEASTRRPRGRPRRDTSLASPPPSPDEPLDGLEENTVSRRPRGRPRRDPSLTTPPSSALSHDEALQGDHAIPRRPRGRPRRDASLVTPPSSALSYDVPLQGLEEEDALPPRPRGRPRRDASPSTAPTSPLAGEDASLDDDSDTPVLPRSRGRPRRDVSPPLVHEESDAPLLPRPRGRPRRQTSPQLVHEEPDVPMLPRARGRPKREASLLARHDVTAQDDTPKRPRGRPRRDASLGAAAQAENASDMFADAPIPGWPRTRLSHADVTDESDLRTMLRAAGFDSESDTDSTSDSESSRLESREEYPESDTDSTSHNESSRSASEEGSWDEYGRWHPREDTGSDTDSTSDSESSGSESSDEWNSDSDTESHRKKKKN
ncbi:hypothetical protein B0H19DRAFT_1203091 [Mycena capillaripes]|nr:hypothetical protein B0H19DRAFT_1203091 [Mycena capillaripes]